MDWVAAARGAESELPTRTISWHLQLDLMSTRSRPCTPATARGLSLPTHFFIRRGGRVVE
jgi:hypothetical protein